MKGQGKARDPRNHGHEAQGAKGGKGEKQGVSQAMATEPTARTGETGAGEGATGEGRPRTEAEAAGAP